MRHRAPFLVAAPAILLSSLSLQPARAVDIHDTRLLSQPTVSRSHVAFVYAGDLWVADLDGRGVRRITTHAGTEASPRFSPDGRSIAFSAEYDGNTDVYLVSVDGGVPRRLTWHPAADVVQGFTSYGSRVLFTSARSVHTRRHQQLFTIATDGGFPERLPVPHAARADYSPDGTRIAYNPLGPVFAQWKNYRGGTVSRIWLYDTRDHAIDEIPQPRGRCNDADPMWVEDRVYFRSDRNGEFNLFSFDTRSRTLEQLTFHRDFPVLSASAGAGRVVYEQAGYLHLLELSNGQSRRLTLGVAADLIGTRPRYVDGGEFIRNATLSPSGARAAFECRGEIVTLPAKKGDQRNLTSTPGAHERLPAWSPDGRQIAYFSDASGEYELHIAGQDGKGEVRRFELDGSGFYDDPRWSPDGKKISFSDNSWTLHWIDLETGATTRVSTEVVYGPIKTLHHAWSPDSRWLVYTRNTPTYFQRIFLYSLESGESTPLTRGLSDVSQPVFDASGKYLYFAASTDAGPVRQWFAMSNADMRSTNALYLAVLQRGVESPLAKESDEETRDKKDDEKAEGQDEGTGEEKEEIRVTVDFDDLDQRIVALPLESSQYSSLQPGEAGQLFYLTSSGGQGLFGAADKTALNRFDLETRKQSTLLEEVDGYVLSGDGKRLLASSDGSWLIAESKDKIDPAKSKIATDGIKLSVDPRAEWKQMFHEAWRINRDYFYDPGMHGADWAALREKYSAFLPDLATRADLNRVLRWMSSELAVGHHFVRGGDTPSEPESVPGGLLGADYEIDRGRYRFSKVFGGLNWNPELRSPLTEPGVDVKTDEYLLAVEGRELEAPENVHGRFENTAGKIVEITVGPNPRGKDSRTVRVVPVDDEAALRNRDWVEGNLRKVDEATNGRVAYVYVPNTTTLGHTYFKRYFFPQADRQALIIDERHNGGGQVADYYIDILRRPHISYWAMRYGADLPTPLAAIRGPKVMLIDETAGSGGDLLPWMFRKLELGTLIGKRTWGGLVGILGFPVLLDGGLITAPNLAIWTEEGWVVENVGVPPDIEVEQLPAEVIAGRDPQLERAIEVILEQLDASPTTPPERPPFPVRVRH